MKWFVQNNSPSLQATLNLFTLTGMWQPEGLSRNGRIAYNCYFGFFFMCIPGIYVVVQTGDLLQVWGDISLMTATSFLLFTNFALTVKILNIVLRGKRIQRLVRVCEEEISQETREAGKEIVVSYNKEILHQLYVYIILTYITIFGWSFGAEKGQLPVRAWYPFDTTTSPTYELIYTQQCIFVAIGAGVDAFTDTLVTCIASQCRCRLRLLALSLRTLCDGVPVTETGLISPEDEKVVYQRFRRCVQRHQAVLDDTAQLEECFSLATLSQFTVSMFIICVTAYQLAFEIRNILGVVSMVSYLLVMMMQVFIYCYQGNQLVEESEDITAATYECPWYLCSVPMRHALLVIMTRATRSVKLTAANLTDLSLDTFVSIIKASYSFFTVLQGVVDVS